ncbi:MAG: hypothetical protein KZQ86_03410 [Candidatus Thiodiazotropha sp. (ex Lucinoma kastoroae)]|nr:hypothetical protein [Candidatus Thiodiazotropha sp. (ex Lucinoma kastoroae)]
MKISWHERLIQDPDLRDFKQWPVIPTDSVPSDNQSVFLRNKGIVSKVLVGEQLQKVAADYAVSGGLISQIMIRCLGGDDGDPPALTQALVPNKVIVAKQRKSILPSLQQPSGNACAFKQLLCALPELKKSLDAKIKAEVYDRPYAEKITPQSFHGALKLFLAEHHWPQDQYPYTSKNAAYSSVRRYYIQRKNEYIQERQARRNANRTPTLRRNHKIRRVLRAIQIDEHSLDLRKRIHLLLNDELIPLPIARATVLTAIDVDAECLLGGILVPTKCANQQDLLALLDACVAPWRAMTLQTPGLSYAPGACFPSGLAEGYPISFGIVSMDNAWMHRAHSVVAQFCNYFGATLNLGIAGEPKVRSLKESVYDFLSEQFSHRVASTTGSYPTDPKKESRKNQKNPPLITYQTADEIQSVVLTEWNVIRRPSIGDATPLELYQYHLDNHFIRYVPESLRQEWKPFAGAVTVPLHWYRHEKRHPHVALFYTRYKGPCLIAIATTDTHIRVEFDRRDVRSVHAYRLNGEYLGEIMAPMTWQRFPHSLATRQWIYTHAKAYRLNMRDPLTSYFDWLLKNRNKPSYALSLLKVYTEYTAGESTALDLSETHESVPMPPTHGDATRFTWDPRHATHRS